MNLSITTISWRVSQELSIETWNYKSQGPSIRHIGPMAQDFYRAFGVGESNRHITTIDADGVTLAAVQALCKRNLELERRHCKTSSPLGQTGTALMSTRASDNRASPQGSL